MNSELSTLLGSFLNKKDENHILEIGSFEGMSSVYFADNFIDDPKSRLTCVDPFLNITDNDHAGLLHNKNVELNFDHNMSICKNADKVFICKTTSDSFFEKAKDHKYNFVYIDGCHEPDVIRRDMKNAFSVLSQNGIMWMDDYRGGDGIQIKSAMDEFLEQYKGKYEIIHIGYQLAICKKC